MPRALVIRAAGTNCDAEMVRGFTLAGAACDLVHIDALVREPAALDAYDLIGFPGGFSYGDDIASGRILAMKLRERVYPGLRAAAARGCLMIGACNGFQVMTQVGLLPGPATKDGWGVETTPHQRLALSDNQGGRFVDRWVGFKVEPGTVCLWTRGLEESTPAAARGQVHVLPVAHGEGRVTADTPGLLAELERRGQVALRYTDNFNGSEGAIAGVCDVTGRIFGLMPHPERYLEWTRHPYWTRLPAEVRRGETPGRLMFRNAVEAARDVRTGSARPVQLA
ncbi:MAG: phosphoribosylformylglycinamidine synthase subunit PurQ [Phycisphaerales bacterium]|nr:phosphoribosylformylglycinamidine synthase subunit PurQ [Phycisphaerales bacterium]